LIEYYSLFYPPKEKEKKERDSHHALGGFSSLKEKKEKDWGI
jgi:hypothetical protein